ncbi:AAA family ATPase [uncultured Ferrimonas sp.]|uniref:AAA family ATPase n=1 Tax=uncultured Ferrimonas sp. TaxID=432640 RepID=UPI002633C53A|nr:AAA family ATPase [uncultured Ferrimonas sp.]
MSSSPLAQIERLIDAIGTGLHERRDIVAVALLTTLAGQSTFLLGPPGTAKSLLARRIAAAFSDSRYFECLMNRFSTPDEVFGPVSIQALKQDRYVRQVDGYLPAVEFAFLDEIWKSSPAILNTLLTIINERQFRNGDAIIDVPLKGLLAASNELPQAEQGLEALYDRFLTRLLVNPTEQWDNFAALLQQPPVSSQITLAASDQISSAQLSQWQQQAQQVQLSPDSLLAIKHLRDAIAALGAEHAIYVSDRRWQRAAQLLKASAHCCGRNHTNHSDLLLLRHCLWSNNQQQPLLFELVEQAIAATASPTNVDLAQCYQQLSQWDSELNQALFYAETIYDTQAFYPQQHFFDNDNEHPIEARDRYFYVKAQARHNNDAREPIYIDFFVHQSQMHSRRPFHPFDPLGPLRENVQCQFSDAGLMQIRYAEYGNFDTSAYSVKPFKPTVLHQQGDARSDQDASSIAALRQRIGQCQQQLQQALAQAKQYQTHYQAQPQNPFNDAAANARIELALAQQYADIELNLFRCDALLALGQD